MFGLSEGRTEVGTAQFGQANLSTTEANTETPMTQLGRAAAPGSIMDHVWFVKKDSNRQRHKHNQIEVRLGSLIFDSANMFVAKPFRTAAA